MAPAVGSHWWAPNAPDIGVFLYKSPFSTFLSILSAPRALAVGSGESRCPALGEQVSPIPLPRHQSRSSGQTLTWHSILSANEPQSQMT